MPESARENAQENAQENIQESAQESVREDVQEDVQGNEEAEKKEDYIRIDRKKAIIISALGLSLLAVLAVVFLVLIPKINAIGWGSNQMIAIYIALGVAAGGVAAWFIFAKTLRTRLRMQKVIRNDPDINDWLVVYDWTPKVLYVPTIAASFLAAIMTFLGGRFIFLSINPAILGGVWFAIFFVNFLVEEYDISIKVLLIVLVSLGFFLLWLNLSGWVWGFFRLFKRIAISMNATVYLLVGIVGLFTILISWLRGLFYYVAITPNYMNLQEGPTESGEQIGREDYNSRVDTSDFLERLMGFGRIIITFKERKRQPITILVWRIRRKAQLLERVRAKFAIDHLQQSQSPRQ